MEIYNYNFKIIVQNNTERLMDIEVLKSSAEELLERIDMVIVGYTEHIFGERNQNTGVFLLSTSHYAWHSFPEDNYVAVSFSTCVDSPPSLKELRTLVLESYHCDNVEFQN